MISKATSFRALLAAAIACLCIIGAAAQNVKRVVIMKIDGLPGYYADQFVRQTDPKTGRSMLPWFEEVFYKNGTRVPNFYTRGPSLSGPAWGILDTGQHMQIKGNVEYDRYTMYAYDYLNFFNYQVKFGLKQRQDMPAAEVLDQLGIPLLSDIFPFNDRYLSGQLYQRGNDWSVLASGFVNLYPGDPGDFIDEWTMGLPWRKVTISQNERDIIGKLAKRDNIDYFDYYDSSFDHVSHHNNDTASRLVALKELDRTIGRIWTAIQDSPRADETALILVSDHGVNSTEKVYSQGFNIVKLLGSAAGGGHHVVTKRRLLLNYSVKGAYPLVPLIKTSSDESFYLDGQTSDYSTALVDFDGNERSSIHLRNSDLNMMHILLQQIRRNKMSAEVRDAASVAFFEIVDRHRTKWRRDLEQMSDELDALHRWINAEQKVAAARPKLTPADVQKGIDNEYRRADSLVEIAIRAERSYREYAATLNNLLALTPETLATSRVQIKDVIAPGAMGDANMLHQLQNYVVGPSARGLVLGKDRKLDLERSFQTVNYFDLLNAQRVRNNVQPAVGSKPVDFIAVRLRSAALADALPEDLVTADDAVGLFGADGKQAIVLSRTERDGNLSYFYLPVKNIRQDAGGRITFERVEITAGLPLKYFDDANFAVEGNRATWFGVWHTEDEWMDAVHKTIYSNAIIGLKEQFNRRQIFEPDDGAIADDERLIRRFRKRQRDLTEPDFVILANNHWNFDVRGFNPGGNHGSFFRVSTNASFMIAGGDKTGIPRGLAVEKPYDGLSFVPTILRLMGKVDENNNPSAELKAKGFRRFPGRPITEIIER